MKNLETSFSHGDYRGYFYEAPVKSMPIINWFFCRKHGVMRCLNNRWRCPLCNGILTKIKKAEAVQMMHGEIPYRLKPKKPKRHYHELW